jgi:hypothetical protein
MASTDRASIASILLRPFLKLPCASGRRRDFLAAQALFQHIRQIDDVAFLFPFLSYLDPLARGFALHQRL